MSSDYNYNLLKKDIKEGKQIVLFVVHPINAYFFSCIASILSSKNFSSLYP